MNWKYFFPCFCNIVPVFFYSEASNPFSFYPHPLNKTKRNGTEECFCAVLFWRQKNFFSDTMQKHVRLLNIFHK